MECVIAEGGAGALPAVRGFEATHVFHQGAIDQARAGGRDDNPLHDPRRHQAVPGGGFGAPVALGFQAALLCEQLCAEQGRVIPTGLWRYQFSYVQPILAGARFSVTAKPAPGGHGHRLCVRGAGGLLLRGGITALTADAALWEEGVALAAGGEARWQGATTLCQPRLRQILAGSGRAAQRPAGARVARVPAMALAALFSRALIEQARGEGLEHTRTPQVYVAHDCIADHGALARLAGGTTLSIVLATASLRPGADGRRRALGAILGPDGAVLLVARLSLTPLTND
ncbi:hypothetical protein J2T57_001224 [Natronocella acetinitrilica]|uniref:Uncharacterized protein n=1 Tax=Natronocella acetinitrilica TaxID=414046 RepID=A0AAE3KFJ2_9GAMM|nr:hypothetical protein [Natronocella acetinitrilica]MCP1674122.1 hypothetical protein [Natronocella acetinitrilica]